MPFQNYLCLSDYDSNLGVYKTTQSQHHLGELKRHAKNPIKLTKYFELNNYHLRNKGTSVSLERIKHESAASQHSRYNYCATVFLGSTSLGQDRR